jgi:hypothetical protein
MQCKSTSNKFAVSVRCQRYKIFICLSNCIVKVFCFTNNEMVLKAVSCKFTQVPLQLARLRIRVDTMRIRIRIFSNCGTRI